MASEQYFFEVTNTIMYKDYANTHPDDISEDSKKRILDNFINNLKDSDTKDIIEYFRVKIDDKDNKYPDFDKKATDLIDRKEFSIDYNVLSDNTDHYTMVVSITLVLDIPYDGDNDVVDIESVDVDDQPVVEE